MYTCMYKKCGEQSEPHQSFHRWRTHTQNLHLQLVDHIGIMLKLPELASTSLTADSREQEMYLQMTQKGKHSQLVLLLHVIPHL